MKRKFRNIIASITTLVLVYIFYTGIVSLLAGLGYRGKYQPAGEANIIVITAALIILLPFVTYYIITTIKYRKRKALADKKRILTKKTVNPKSIKLIKYNGKDISYYTTKAGKLEKEEINSVVMEIPIDGILKKYSFNTTKSLDAIQIALYLQKEVTIVLDENELIVSTDFNFLK